ncbi:hypothetical protein [Crossiella sp. NPDC003009]
MANIQDLWWRPKKGPVTGAPVLTKGGKPAREKTPQHGKGARYRVR